MERKAWAHEVRAFTRYRSADGTVGVTALQAGIQFKNGLYTGGTFSAAGLPLTTDNITISGTAGNGYIQYAAQTARPSLALVHTYVDSGGHFAIGRSGSSAFDAIFTNGLMTADRNYAFPNKDGTFAMTDDNVSQFTNDARYVVGPSGSVADRITTFDGTTGRLVKDSGIVLSGTSGKSLTLTGGLTIGADTSITGGGTVGLGGFTLTVPATGTAVLTSRTLSEGAGLAGNTYDLSANRTLAMGTPSTLSVSSTNAVSGTTHSHVITSSSNPGTAAQILSTDASGFLTLRRLTVTDYAFVNAATANLYLKDTSTGFKAATTLIVTPQSGNTFRNTAFTSGVVGWNINDAGDAEFNNVRVRGELASSIFKVSEISATAGTLGVFKSAAKLSFDFTTPAVGSQVFVYLNLTDAGAVPVAAGDRIRIKTWTGSAIADAWLSVTSATSTPPVATCDCTMQSGTVGTVFRAGTAVVDYGPSGTGFITLSADGTVGSSPNLTMATHAGSPWSTFTNLLRLGNLNGSYGYATDAYGLGIGSYGVSGQSWIIADATNGVRIGNNTTTLYQVDTSGNQTNGQTGSGQSNVYIASGAVKLRNNTTDVLTLDTTNGLQIFGSGNSLVQLDPSGNARFGQVATDKANAYWNASNNRLEFRGSTSGTSVQSYIDTDGSITLIGAAQVQFRKSDGTLLGQVGGYSPTAPNIGLYSSLPSSQSTSSSQAYILADNNGALGALVAAIAFGTAHATRASQNYVYISGSGGFQGLVIGSSVVVPAYMLDVYAGSVNDAAASFRGSGSITGVYLNATATNGHKWGLLSSASGGAGAGAFGLYDDTASAYRVIVSSAGNVRFNAYGAGTLSTDASGNITASSDEKLKTKIRRFRKGLATIKKLEPIIYRWNKKSGLDRKNDYVGFGARHTKKHIPEAVGKGQNGFHTMSDRAILATVVNAIKELEEIVCH